jgi:hypothetical protein
MIALLACKASPAKLVCYMHAAFIRCVCKARRWSTLASRNCAAALFPSPTFVEYKCPMSLVWLELLKLLKGRSGMALTQFSSSSTNHTPAVFTCGAHLQALWRECAAGPQSYPAEPAEPARDVRHPVMLCCLHV